MLFEGTGEIVAAEAGKLRHFLQGKLLPVMVVDIGHDRVDNLGVHVSRAVPGMRFDAAQVPLAQRGVDAENAAVAQGVPKHFPLLIGVIGPEQQFPDAHMGIRSIPEMERPVEIGSHVLDIPHGHDGVRLKQEKIPAAAFTHGQGMQGVRGDDQDFPLADLVEFVLNGVGHRALQRQEDFHRGVVMGFVAPGNIRIPDPDG